jgi:tartrate dehydrogenase/decarboxylase/D-malate dehydrogenase
MHRIGLIVGGGTGQEVAQVFKTAVARLGEHLKLKLEIEECPHRAKTYWEVRGWSLDQIKQTVREDVDELMAFLRKFYESGGRAIFRTAINAESLYQMRRLGRAAKIVSVVWKNSKILMVRDQVGGFYSNEQYVVSPDRVEFAGTMTREGLHELLDFAIEAARAQLADGYKSWVLYKYHLFANVLEQWVKEKEPTARMFQPDTGIHLLFKHLREPDCDLMLVTGNEIGDMLHEFLILHLGLGTKDLLHSRNVYLHESLRGLVEYQTIHGSADDIAGRNCINPLATMRAVGGMIEDELGVEGFYAAVERAICEAEETDFKTPDIGGNKTTSEVVEYLIERVMVNT